MRRLCLLLILLWASGLAARAEQPAPTAIVVDSSGSMAAALEGATRLDAARGVLRQLLGEWPADAPLALLAYGHRRTGDCADIEVLAPLAPPDPAALGRRLDELRARGKTPLAASLQRAATLLPAGGGGTIILLTDGLETCDADPCAVARALHESAAATTVHVVGFGVTAEEGRELACIAEAGGGLYRGADDAAQLLDSLGAVAEAALAEPLPEPQPEPAPEPAVAEPEPAPTPQQVAFVAVYAGGSQVIDQAAQWSVAALEDTPAFTYAGGGRGLALTLAPGRYRVTAALANASAAAEFTVAGEAATVSVALPVGRLRASVVPAKGQAPLGAQEAPRWTLEPLDGQPAVGDLAGAAPDLLLATGRYRLAVTKDLWQASREIAIDSGATLAAELSLGLGALALEAALDETAEPITAWQGATWSVLAADGSVLLEQAQVAQPRFLLPAGQWQVRFSLSGWQATERFAVAEGEERRGRVVLPAGTVILTAALAPGLELFTDWRDSIWTVTAVEALGQAPGDTPVAGLPANNPEVTLAPGRWRVGVQSDRAEAATEITVAPGSTQTLRLDLGAGRVTLRAAPPAGTPAPQNIVFEVAPLDAAGQPGERITLGGTFEELAAILPAGRWVAYASDERGRAGEAGFDLAPGADLGLDLPLR